jgi:hypothetical protein
MMECVLPVILILIYLFSHLESLLSTIIRRVHGFFLQLLFVDAKRQNTLFY